MVWVNRLKKALKQQDGYSLFLEYQPIENLATGFIAGYEALLRLRMPGACEVVTAGAFIDSIADSHRLIRNIDWWVIRQVCKVAQRTGLSFAVNVEHGTLRWPYFPKDFSNTLYEFDLNPNQIVIEIVERGEVDEDCRLNLVHIHESGIPLSLDDMGAIGSRHSGFCYLTDKLFPVVKLDGAMVRTIPDCEDSRILIKGLLEIALLLNKCVVVEGVESEEIKNWLKANAPHSDGKPQLYIQGWAVGMPISESELQ